MLLAIDVGNTNMVFGIYEGEELKGSFRLNSPAYGSISANTEFGLYGDTYSDIINKLYPQGVEMASRNSVKEGKATILTTIDGQGIQEYEINIIKAN